MRGVHVVELGESIEELAEFYSMPILDIRRYNRKVCVFLYIYSLYILYICI